MGLEVLSDGSICGYFDSHHCSIISNKGDIVVNKNYHVVFIMNNPNDETQIFVNGLVVKTSLENRTLKGNNANLIIGKSELLQEFFFNGQLDNIRIYNRALSESEIQELYHEGEVCDDRYDEGYEAGKQYCIDNPVVCGINTTGGYTAADLDTAEQNGYDRGYQAGVSSCDDSTPPISGNNCATFDVFSNTFHVPCFNGGSTMYWLDWELSGSDPIMLELKDIGTN